MSITIPADLYKILNEQAQRRGLSISKFLASLLKNLPGEKMNTVVCDGGGVVRDETDEYFAKLRRWGSKPEYTDDELMRAVLKEAKNDCFCGVGRVFIDEFVRDYCCPRERLIRVLEQSGLKWRFGPGETTLLIEL